MAIHCGVDIVEISRIKHSMEASFGNAFRDRVFTAREIEYCEGKKKSRYQSYAARFAAKEAVSKALGTGISSGMSWKDIEILNDEGGKPYGVLSNKAKELFDNMCGNELSLSLSHCDTHAVAYVIIATEK